MAPLRSEILISPHRLGFTAVDGLVPVAADWPKVARSQATCSGVNGDDIRASRLVESHLNDNE